MVIFMSATVYFKSLRIVKMKIMKIVFLIVVLVFWVTPVFSDQTDKGQCPQKRTTKNAPENFLKLTNPLELTEERLKKGKIMYLKKVQPMQCVHCHGIRGDGTGELGLQANPQARNFTCKETMKNISDGQMFWAIKNGIAGTAMPAYSDLADWQIWTLIHYVRHFGN